MKANDFKNIKFFRRFKPGTFGLTLSLTLNLSLVVFVIMMNGWIQTAGAADSLVECGLDCNYQKATENITVQGNYITKKLKQLKTDVQDEERLEAACGSMKSVCNVETCSSDVEQAQACFNKYYTLEAEYVRRLANNKGKSEDVLASLKSKVTLFDLDGSAGQPKAKLPEIKTLKDLEKDHDQLVKDKKLNGVKTFSEQLLLPQTSPYVVFKAKKDFVDQDKKSIGLTRVERDSEGKIKEGGELAVQSKEQEAQRLQVAQELAKQKNDSLDKIDEYSKDIYYDFRKDLTSQIKGKQTEMKQEASLKNSKESGAKENNKENKDSKSKSASTTSKVIDVSQLSANKSQDLSSQSKPQSNYENKYKDDEDLTAVDSQRVDLEYDYLSMIQDINSIQPFP